MIAAADQKAIAAAVAATGSLGVPTVVLSREVPLFEVDFSALGFDQEVTIPAIDWAALALARALGEMSPADVDGYLGLGAAVSEGLVLRLLEDGLIEEGDAGVRPPVRTSARTLRESRARRKPVCRLSEDGMRSLQRGVIARHHVRSARMLFVAEPLIFLNVVDESRSRYWQHRRPGPLNPELVPESLRTIDTVFALSPAERFSACGIENGIRGFAGRFVGVKPGAQWEVRQVERRTDGGREPEMALLVLAAFPAVDGVGLHWHAYLQRTERVRDCPHIDAGALVPESLRVVSSLLNEITAAAQLPETPRLRSDGAFDIRCDCEAISHLLGASDRPEETFLATQVLGWAVGLRTHATPTDRDGAQAAFYEFLRRRDATLRRNFDETCADVARGLISYWGEDPGLPSADDAAIFLWHRAELRAALCKRRRYRDLITPYGAQETER